MACYYPYNMLFRLQHELTTLKREVIKQKQIVTAQRETIEQLQNEQKKADEKNSKVSAVLL